MDIRRIPNRLKALAAGAAMLAVSMAVAVPSSAVDFPGAAVLEPFGVRLVRVAGGEFTMGSTDGDAPDEAPRHTVRLRSFYIATTEITQAQWNTVMGSDPSFFKGCPECPVESVSWLDVQEFLKKLSERAGVSLRLPTESEWEYAAGGGAAHTGWAGTSDEGSLGDYAWYGANAERKTHPVGGKKPNAYGLFDMSGNVWEFCSDWHGENYYAESPAENPTGPARGFGRILRGGSWINSANGVRTTIRHRIDPGFRTINLNGFRLAADEP